jgi:hypothetical protein
MMSGSSSAIKTFSAVGSITQFIGKPTDKGSWQGLFGKT